MLLVPVGLIILLDQWTKSVAVGALEYLTPVPVLPGLNWTLVHNMGGAFSFLSNNDAWQRWFFLIVSSVVTVVPVEWLRRTAARHWLLCLPLALLIGGAIGNLIDNAVKYSDRHTPVTVLVRPGDGWADVVVQDDGIGISHAEQERVFERFYRADSARSSSDGGASWVSSGPAIDVDLTSVDFTDELKGHAVGRDGVYLATADGGSTWTVRTLGEDDLWAVELRHPGPKGSAPFGSGVAGEELRLSGGGVAGGVFDRSLIGLKLARDGHAPVGSIAWAAAQNVSAVPAPART